MDNKYKLLLWIKKHNLLSIHGLEKRAGIPQSVLDKALKGNRPLPEKYIPKLIEILKEYGYKE